MTSTPHRTRCGNHSTVVITVFSLGLRRRRRLLQSTVHTVTQHCTAAGWMLKDGVDVIHPDPFAIAPTPKVEGVFSSRSTMPTPQAEGMLLYKGCSVVQTSVPSGHVGYIHRIGSRRWGNHDTLFRVVRRKPN